jgi:hypothetical protein
LYKKIKTHLITWFKKAVRLSPKRLNSPRTFTVHNV